MQPIHAPAPVNIHNWKTAALLVAFQFFLFSPLARSQQHDMESMPGMNMSAPAAPEDPARAAKHLADKQESEFNHHLAGLFVFVAGIFLLGESRLAQHWPVVRYAWPMCFLAAGLFLLVFSDRELWPFGPRPWYALNDDTEALQHKIFALILLALGFVEFQRVRGRLKSLWAAWFFPVMSFAGAVLLLFHVHSGDMHAPHAMESMELIQKQHRWFAATGVGVALANAAAAISHTPSKWRECFKTAWPSLLIVLGVLLMHYTE